MQTTIIGSNAIFVVYVHIGVGFGVARFDEQAMPEPLKVGRVTGRFPRFFVFIATANNVKTAKCWDSAWIENEMTSGRYT
ncbi:MAG: hypothetical protein IKQ59_14810 [Prevotella sp.]|nr:hypothetical protein [Prevotella sp.]